MPPTPSSARLGVCSLLACFLVACGCARVSSDIPSLRPQQAVLTPAPGRSRGPVITHGIGHGQQLALESHPSAHAAALLPAHARYRVVLMGPGELALLVVSPGGKISGRLRVRPLATATGGPAASIAFDDLGAPQVQIDAWSTIDGLRGDAWVGDRAARWRVRLDTDGSLSGQAWSAKQGSRGPELAQLRRAQVISADLGQLGAQLQRGAPLEPSTATELLELLTLVELSLELSVRAWEGRGRSQLPRIL